jgi:hypothetical protein
MTLTTAGSEQQAVLTAFGYFSCSAKGGEVGKEQVSAVLDGVSGRTNDEAEIRVDLLRTLLNIYATHYQPVYITTKIVENADVATSTSAVNKNQTCSKRNAAGGVNVTGCVGGGGGDKLPQVENLEALKVVGAP